MLIQHLARSRMHREDEPAAVAVVERGDDRAQPVGLGVRLAVDRQRGVGRRVRQLEPSSDRFEQPRCIAHHVAHDLPSAGHALLLELRRGALVGAEEEGRQPVDLDPVSLFGHRQVEAAQPGLDVRDRHLFARGVRPGQGRVRIAVDEHPVGPLRLDHLADRRGHRYRVGRPQVEPVSRLGDAELVEEDLRHGGSQCCPVCSTTSSIPASRSATESGADLMNCGRFPTTESTFVTLATIRGASRAVSSAGRAGDS